MTDPKLVQLQELFIDLMPVIGPAFEQTFNCELVSRPQVQCYELVDDSYHLDDVQGVCRVQGIADHPCLFDLVVEKVPNKLLRISLDNLRIHQPNLRNE